MTFLQPPDAMVFVSVVSVALVEAVVAVEADVPASVLAEPGRFCGVASLRGFGESRDPSLDQLVCPQ